MAKDKTVESALLAAALASTLAGCDDSVSRRPTNTHQTPAEPQKAPSWRVTPNFNVFDLNAEAANILAKENALHTAQSQNPGTLLDPKSYETYEQLIELYRKSENPGSESYKAFVSAFRKEAESYTHPEPGQPAIVSDALARFAYRVAHYRDINALAHLEVYVGLKNIAFMLPAGANTSASVSLWDILHKGTKPTGNINEDTGIRALDETEKFRLEEDTKRVLKERHKFDRIEFPQPTPTPRPAGKAHPTSPAEKASPPSDKKERKWHPQDAGGRRVYVTNDTPWEEFALNDKASKDKEPGIG